MALGPRPACIMVGGLFLLIFRLFSPMFHSFPFGASLVAAIAWR